MILASRRRNLAGLILILIVAAAMRFSDLGISEYWYNDGAVSSLAQSLATGKAFPLLGIRASVGIPNPPESIYVPALPFFFSTDSLFALGFIALLNVIGVGLLWLIVYRYIHRAAAFVSGLIYAVSPWAVLYSRRIWAQDYHTPFILAGLLLAFYGFIDGKRWAQILCLPVLCFGMEIHFAAWALLPVYLWILWIGRKRVARSAVFLSVILALLTIIPFAIGISQVYLPSGSAQRLSAANLSFQTLPLLYVSWLITGQGLDSTFAIPASASFIGQSALISALWLTMLALLVLGLWAMWRRSPTHVILLFLWTMLPPLILLPGWVLSKPYYFTASIPGFCLLIGEGVLWLADRKIATRRLAPLAFGLIGLILITQVVNWRGFLHFVDTELVAEPPGFLTPIHYYLGAITQLKSDVLLLPGHTEYGHHYVWSPLLFGQASCVREVVMADGDMAVLPQGAFSVLRAPDSAPYAYDSLYRSSTSVIYPLRASEGTFTIDQFEQAPAWDGPPLTAISSVQFDNGIMLNGYTLALNRVYLDWHLPGPSEQDFQYSVNLLNAKGDRIAQHDASFWPGKYWCPNDRIITWIDLDQPADAATLRVSMYLLDNGSIESSNVIDTAGNAIAPWIDISFDK